MDLGVGEARLGLGPEEVLLGLVRRSEVDDEVEEYRYYDAWRTRRDREKFDHVLEFAALLPSVRKSCATALAQPGLPKERVLAGATRLLDVGFFRIGGEDYAEDNGTYGLATLLKRHARIAGEEVIFDYPAKTGKRRVQAIVDPMVRQVIGELKVRRGGGPELLAYKDGRRWVDVRSADINDFLRQVSGLEISAKDFRTWNATVLAAVALSTNEPPSRQPCSICSISRPTWRPPEESLG